MHNLAHNGRTFDIGICVLIHISSLKNSKCELHVTSCKLNHI